MPSEIFSRTPADSGFALQIDGSPQYLGVQVPSGEHPLRAAAIELLKRHGFQLDVLSRVWRLLGKHAVLSFLAAHRETLLKKFHARFTPGFLERTAAIATARLDVRAGEDAAGGFTFSARIAAGGLSENALREALQRGQGYAETANGKIVLLPPEVIAAAQTLEKQIAENADERGAPLPRFERRISPAGLADIENTLDSLAIPFTPPAAWAARSAALRNLSALRQPPCEATLWARLRLYQQIGAAWLWHLHTNELGGILADEMGLGKTVQALAFLTAVLAPPAAAALVVCPAALIENWRRETARFAPALRVCAHHGSGRDREAAAWADCELVITSYATLARDLALFRAHRWTSIIADEAQHIKNARSLNARSLRSLHTASRFVLTGTPIENSFDDLRSLFAFLMPGYLPEVPRDSGGKPWADERARQKAAPYILRRAKRMVAPELPEKIEQTLCVALEGGQAAFYEKYRDQARTEIFELEMSGASEGRTRMAAFTHLLRLRQICAEPRLLEPALDAAESAKYRALREILDEAADGGHRLLVFSQFAEVLRLLRTDLAADGIATCYLDGNTRDRQAECDRFNADTSIPAFLISLKAGGVGLNLTGADTVVHLDPWWNPAAEAQATDRAHRIGQKRVVTSLKLIATRTVEERVLDMQREKSALLRDILEAGDAATAKIALADMKALLA